MNLDALRNEIRTFLKFEAPSDAVQFDTLDVTSEPDYGRVLIRYRNEEDEEICAFLLRPRGTGPFPAVLVHHQHNGQRHFGKSEVCGLVGDPLQAFGPVLARRGFVVLAPDSIGFEDRRRNRAGVEPDADADWLQHYNEMCYRLLRGDTLMRRVLQDAALGVSLLQSHPEVDRYRIGTLGHSYGGNTVLFLSGLDQRIAFNCSSGAACTYAHKMRCSTGIEMAEVIPDIANRFDIAELVKCVAPRRILIVSGSDDQFSKDADVIVSLAKETFAGLGAERHLEHHRYTGGHAVSHDRFTNIIGWVTEAAIQIK